MLHIGLTVVGVDDMDRAIAFWSQALGYELDHELDEERTWAELRPRSGAGARLGLMRSETPVQDHPRLHLDLHTADAAEQAAEVERLVGLGATRVDWDSYDEDPDYVVLADTEGNIFCVVDETHG